MSKAVSLIFFVLLVVLIGMLIGYATLPGEWYAGLNKPWFTPPNRVFAPVWTVLYIVIAVAGWRCWLRDRQRRDEAVVCSDGTQFFVVARVLRGSTAEFSSARRSCRIGGCLGLHLGCLEQRQAGGSAVPALCGMDRICYCAYSGRRGDELICRQRPDFVGSGY